MVHAPAGAVLKVGGRAIPPDQWTRPVISMPGAVDVVLADATGKELARQTVAATGGQQSSVTIDAQPAPPPAPPAAANPDDRPDFSQAPPPAATPSSGRAYLRPWAYGAGAVGVVGFGLFTAFGLMSNSDYNDLKSACVGGRCPPGKSGEISDGKTFQTVANVGLVAGIVGVAAGGTLFVLSLTGKSSDSTGFLVGPSYVGYRGNL